MVPNEGDRNDFKEKLPSFQEKFKELPDGDKVNIILILFIYYRYAQIYF
jgi:hypothetical protein